MSGFTECQECHDFHRRKNTKTCKMCKKDFCFKHIHEMLGGIGYYCEEHYKKEYTARLT